MILALQILLIVGPLAGTSDEPRLGRDYVIRIAEMETDLVTFEIFLPESQAGRKNVPHHVLDSNGSVIATQRFGTSDGHYKLAMPASYASGEEYRLRIDGAYELRFVYFPGKRDPTS
jgi:hypothetical protein